MPFFIGRVKFKFKFFLKDNFNFTLLGRVRTLWKGCEGFNFERCRQVVYQAVMWQVVGQAQGVKGQLAWQGSTDRSTLNLRQTCSLFDGFWRFEGPTEGGLY